MADAESNKISDILLLLLLYYYYYYYYKISWIIINDSRRWGGSHSRFYKSTFTALKCPPSTAAKKLSCGTQKRPQRSKLPFQKKTSFQSFLLLILLLITRRAPRRRAAAEAGWNITKYKIYKRTIKYIKRPSLKQPNLKTTELKNGDILKTAAMGAFRLT